MLKLANQRESNRSSETKPGLGEKWIRVANGTFQLAELQFQLFQLDAKTWFGTTGLTVAGFGLGVSFLLSGLMAVSGAAAIGLTLMGLHLLWALLIVGVLSLLVGGLLVLAAIFRVRKTLVVFERSQAEMVNNLEWLKAQFSENHQ